MKYSVTTYSYSALVREGKYSEFELIALAAEMGFEGIEFSELNTPEGETKADYAKRLNDECRRVGITPVCYSIGADMLYAFDGDLEREIERLKGEVDIAAQLGVCRMRHDATGGWRGDDKKNKGFAEALPRIIKGCREVTLYAQTNGIETMVENHGLFCQESSRVEQIVTGVAEPNFGLLLDLGNFMCADESSADAVGRVVQYAKHIHAKDFHFKSGNSLAPVNGFFRTRGGNYLRGAVIGHGVLPVLHCMQMIKSSGYDGFITVEFEGAEDAKLGVSWGLAELKRAEAVIEAM